MEGRRAQREGNTKIDDKIRGKAVLVSVARSKYVQMVTIYVVSHITGIKSHSALSQCALLPTRSSAIETVAF
jgi:hypothetical protein